MLELKVRKIGNSLGIVFPKESLLRLRVKEGESLYFTEAPDLIPTQSSGFLFDIKEFKRPETAMPQRLTWNLRCPDQNSETVHAKYA